ncbi:unnamed protein product [Eretmochelys imbricata]
MRWEDTRQHVPDNSKRFDSSRCVLGQEGSSSGRHYWEVEVEDGGTQAMGVARASVRRKGQVGVNLEEGIWAVDQCGSQHLALTSSKIPRSLAEWPRMIGIYLDCKGWRVAFFDPIMRPQSSLSHRPLSPGGKILPLLCLGRGSQFRLCPCIRRYYIEAKPLLAQPPPLRLPDTWAVMASPLPLLPGSGFPSTREVSPISYEPGRFLGDRGGGICSSAFRVPWTPQGNYW